MDTIQKVKIHNMTSPRGNKEVPNQFIITTEEGRYFQSYNSIIAFIPARHSFGKEDATIVLDEKYWDYSTTTGKYRNQFLDEDKKETQRKIAAGIYKLVNLND